MYIYMYTHTHTHTHMYYFKGHFDHNVLFNQKKKTNKWERGRFVLWIFCSFYLGLPGDSVIKNLPANAGGRCGFSLWSRKIPWRRKWQPTPVFLPGVSHGQRNLGALVNEVAKSWMQLSIHTHVHFTSQTLYRQEDKQTSEYLQNERKGCTQWYDKWDFSRLTCNSSFSSSSRLSDLITPFSGVAVSCSGPPSSTMVWLRSPGSDILPDANSNHKVWHPIRWRHQKVKSVQGEVLTIMVEILDSSLCSQNQMSNSSLPAKCTQRE